MFQWIKHRTAAHKAAAELVEYVVIEVPVERERLLSRARLTRKDASAVRRVASSASRFAIEQNANVFWRAYLANRVRWALQDAGYTAAFVENIVSTIVVAMSHGSLRSGHQTDACARKRTHFGRA